MSSKIGMKNWTPISIHSSARFNDFINRHNLIEHKLPNRKYTWSNGRRFAILDRMFTTFEWDSIYPSRFITDSSSFGSDHYPLILHTSSHPLPLHHSFRFDSQWLEQEKFIRLVHKWWEEFKLQPNNLGVSWHKKLKYMKRKISGWAKNFYCKKKRDKQLLLDKIHSLELV